MTQETKSPAEQMDVRAIAALVDQKAFKHPATFIGDDDYDQEFHQADAIRRAHAIVELVRAALAKLDPRRIAS